MIAPPTLVRSSSLEKALLQTASSMNQDQVSPRIARALLQLEAAESLLAKSRAQALQPSLWLSNKLLAANSLGLNSQSLIGLRNRVHSSSPLHQHSAVVGQQCPPLDAILQTVASRRSTNSNSHLPASALAKHLEKPGNGFCFRDTDILCGRGGKSNHHAGNKRFRKVVSQMKASYKNIGTKSAKTELSKAIVDHVHQYGGRFVRQDKATGTYIVLGAAEARKKTSQALREAKDVKWTS